MLSKVDRLLKKIKDVAVRHEPTLKVTQVGGRYMIVTKDAEGKAKALVELNFFKDED